LNIVNAIKKIVRIRNRYVYPIIAGQIGVACRHKELPDQFKYTEFKKIIF